ncbi:MAG: ABC transporter ATP-binding protein, partial [Atopobiaceae bacterium]|nr:ABC transporter ATP-binding protein [Atopobiaceae bacterium]
MSEYALEIRDYTFSYGSTGVDVLHDISFGLEDGSFAVPWGPSGSGKSTLLRALKPALAVAGSSRGTVRVLGDDPYLLSPVESASTVGFVMQDPENQIVTDTVWHELAFGLESVGMDTQTMHRRVAETAHFFDKGSWFDRRTADLSGGQKQLLNLAAIVVMQPAVLVLDEPTSQLDPIAAKGFFDVLERVNAELGITVLITEHRLEDVLPLADRVLYLERGGTLAYDGDCDGFVRMLEKNDEGLYAALPAATRMGMLFERAGRDPGGHITYPFSVREGRS